MIVAEHRLFVPFGHRLVRKLRRVEFLTPLISTLNYERNPKTMAKRFVGGLLAIALILSAAPAFAGFGITTSGAATEIAKPADARTGKLESNESIHVWLETPEPVTGAVRVDHDGSAANFPSDTPIADVVSGPYCSYLIHFDSVGNSNVSLSGAVTFARKIIGVIFTGSNLQASNHLGSPTLFDGANGKVEIGQDSISISGNTLSFSLRTTGGKDEIRVLTAVPEPGTMGVFAVVGLTTLGVRRLRRRRS